MNIKEIRIGNIVKEGDNGFPIKVVGVYDDVVYTDFEGNEGSIDEIPVNNIYPVKINIDWLKSIGFKEDFDESICYYNFTMNKEGRSVNIIQDLFGVKGWHLTIANNEYYVDYIHEVQNILFIESLIK